MKNIFTALIFLVSATILMAQNDTISIDFGDPGASNISAAPWNNLTDPKLGTLGTLLDNNSVPTNVSIAVTDSFNGINTAGVTTDPNLIPEATKDSFFGSLNPGVGGNEVTGGFTISGLDVNLPYSFGIFASRVSGSDNRETRYVVEGETTDSAFLDVAVSNPGPTMVWVNNIFPKSDGTIVLTASAGPNNTNSTGYYYFGLLKIAYELPPATSDTVDIDFGDVGSNTTAPWNNLNDFSVGSLSDLTNTNGMPTGMDLVVTDSFNGINTAGITNDPNLPASATGDSFFGSLNPGVGGVHPIGILTLSGLDPAEAHSFGFFASRISGSDNRETKYTVSGMNTDSTFLDPAVTNPNPRMMWVYNIMPAADSTVTISVTAGPNNTNSVGYYYIGLMRIAYNSNMGSGLNSNIRSSAKVYPNPSSGTLNVEVLGSVIQNIEFYTVDGSRILSVDGNLQSSQNVNAQELPKGLYFIKVETPDEVRSSKVIIE